MFKDLQVDAEHGRAHPRRPHPDLYGQSHPRRRALPAPGRARRRQDRGRVRGFHDPRGRDRVSPQGHPRKHQGGHQPAFTCTSPLRSRDIAAPRGRQVHEPTRRPLWSSSACRTRKRRWPSRSRKAVAAEPTEPEVIKKERAEKEEEEKPKKKEGKEEGVIVVGRRRPGESRAGSMPETRHNVGFLSSGGWPGVGTLRSGRGNSRPRWPRSGETAKGWSWPSRRHT